MWFIVHMKDGEMHMGTVHKNHLIMEYIKKYNLVKEECKIFDGNRLEWNTCYKEWDHAIISSCSHCNRDMTAWPHGKFPCDISYEDGCPDKGDGGW
jgi:hypothetical protein